MPPGPPPTGEARPRAALPRQKSRSLIRRISGGASRQPKKRGLSWGRTPKHQPGSWHRQATRPRFAAGVPLGAPATRAGKRPPLRRRHWCPSQAAPPGASSSCPSACGGSPPRARPGRPRRGPGRRHPGAGAGGRAWSFLSFPAWRWPRSLRPPPPLRCPGAPHRPRPWAILPVPGGRASAGPESSGALPVRQVPPERPGGRRRLFPRVRRRLPPQEASQRGWARGAALPGPVPVPVLAPRPSPPSLTDAVPSPLLPEPPGSAASRPGCSGPSPAGRRGPAFPTGPGPAGGHRRGPPARTAPQA